MKLTRRAALLGLIATPAHAAEKRAPVPQGGSVLLPAPYKLLEGAYGEGDRDALIAYRNWRHTMSGYPWSDGMLAVGGLTPFSLEDFAIGAGHAVTIDWVSAKEKPRTRFTTTTELFPIVHSVGPFGPELVRELSVHTVGWLDVYERPARMYAVEHQRGLRVALWILDKHGGVKQARKLADKIARSFVP